MVWVFIWFLCGIICAIIARNKNRTALGWFFVGLILGPIGLLIAAVISRVIYCDYCERHIPPYGGRKRGIALTGGVSGHLNFCSPSCRNKFIRDSQTRGYDIRGEGHRPFEDS